MKNPAVSRDQYTQILNQYGLHKYNAKRLTCKVTIVCKNLDELVLVQLLARERNWTKSKTHNIYVYMQGYVRYLPEFNPNIETPVFPLYISFADSVFKRDVLIDRKEPSKRRLVEFSKFFTLKPEFRGHKLKNFGI